MDERTDAPKLWFVFRFKGGFVDIQSHYTP